MQIKCPECGAKLSLGQPKPGRYKPKCKHCGKPFIVQVGDGDPPKIAIGKIKPKISDGQAAKGKPAATIDAAVEATMDSAAPAAAAEASSAAIDKTAGEIDATMDSAAGQPPSATDDGVDATMDSAAGTSAAAQRGADVDATMDSANATNVASKTAGVEATMDQTVQDSAAEPAAKSSPQVRSSTSRSDASRAVAGKSSASDSVSSVTGSKKVAVSRGSAASGSKPAKSDSNDVAPLPERLGGYRIMRVLGRGAMGAVYEAKQVSLDRQVALKTIRGRMANNPASLARFTREAYAAAQLTHHNVVQIYDFGEDGGKHFFSMEWVRGGPLSDLIRDKGAIEPKLAVGYTLQAARGLQFAHRNGMVHRDVKPANLLLSDEGVVKVADLGLVKIPDQIDPDPAAGSGSVSGLQSGTQVTMHGTAVGTPAYMAPEQGIDAASVDHRADIYSLGCSLFYLLAGKPPFDGADVSTVLEQHAKQQVPELTQINARIPDELQKIVEKSMAKRPDDRYDSLSDMIQELEGFLGISDDGKFSPSTEQADAWEKIAKQYAAAAPMLRLSGSALLVFAGVCALLTLILPFVSLSWLLLGPAALVAGMATAVAMGAGGGRSAVAGSARRWISSLSWFDLLVGGVGAIVFLLVVLTTGIWLGFLVGAIVGVIAGAAYHFVLIAPSRRAQTGPLMEAEKFIRDLRIEGADEEGIRSFVARYAGKHWQGIYEDLFGYDSLCKMRERLKADPTFKSSQAKTGIRDRVCAALRSKAETNQQADDLKRLSKIEEKGLESEGVSGEEARERALQMASAIIENAKAQAASIQAAAGDEKAAAEAKRNKFKAMMADARSGKYAKKRDPLAPLKFILGGQTRLLVACILLALFAMAAQAKGLVDIVQSEDLDLQKLLKDFAWEFSLGTAGVFLALSAFVSGWRMTPFAVVATIVMLFGPSFGIPPIGPIAAWMVSAAIGLAIYIPGMLFGESDPYAS